MKSAASHMKDVAKKYKIDGLEPTRNIVEQIQMMKEFELKRDE